MEENLDYLDSSRVQKGIFWKVWIALAFVLTGGMVLIVWGLQALDIVKGWGLIYLTPIVLLLLIWSQRLKVLPRWEYVWEWFGQVGEPLTPGWYFIPRFFGLFRLVARVPMYDQFLNIISGERKGINQDLIDSHPYGTNSDIEPKSGAVVKIIYSLRIRCEDSVAAVYKMEDPFSYLAFSIEKSVVRFAKTKDSESLSDEFNSHDWQTEIDDLAGNLFAKTGFRVLELIPHDIANTVEVQNLRNKVGEKQVERELLGVELKNKEFEVQIAEKDNEIKLSRLAVMNKSLNDSRLVAAVWQSEVKAEAIKVASKGGNLILMDASDGDAFIKGAAGTFLKKSGRREEEQKK
ncbi:MAG: hypothetical protein ACOX6C_02490 [Patescibacteria group bacterium]|jgi:hypothetical protein